MKASRSKMRVAITISGNRIFNNGKLGIDLGGDGVTTNDTGDGDTGPNQLQNFPLITSATSDGVSTSTVHGTLNSTASTTFRLEFFASAACDASGNGEGQLYLGGEDVLTDGNGDVSFSINLAAGIPEGYVVTGTATGPDGSTSEFSACQAAVVTPPVQEDMDYDWHYAYDPLYRLTYACTDWDAINAVCVN